MCSIFYSVSIVIIMLSGIDSIKEKCKAEGDLIQRCAFALPVLSTPEISFALNKEELEKSCTELRSGIRCINNYTEQCMEKNEQVVFRHVYAGITEVIDDLCTQGTYQEDYLRHADCVKTVRADYEVCSVKYEVTLNMLNSNPKNEYHTDEHALVNHDDYLRTVCCSFQEYLSCSEATVQRICGDEAAMFTSEFLKRMASNIIKHFCLEYRGHECNVAASANLPYYSFSLLSVAMLSTILHSCRQWLVAA